MTFALNHMAYFTLTKAFARAAGRLGPGARRFDRLGGALRRAGSISTTCNARAATAA